MGGQLIAKTFSFLGIGICEGGSVSTSHGLVLPVFESPLMSTVLDAFKRCLDEGDEYALSVYAEREEIFARSHAFDYIFDSRIQLLQDSFKERKEDEPLFWDYDEHGCAMMPPGTEPTEEQRQFLERLIALDLHKRGLHRRVNDAYLRYKASVEKWFRETQSPSDVEEFEQEERIWRTQEVLTQTLRSESSEGDPYADDYDKDEDDENDAPEDREKYPTAVFSEVITDLNDSVEWVVSNAASIICHGSNEIAPEIKERMGNAYHLLLDKERERTRNIYQAKARGIAKAHENGETNENRKQLSGLMEFQKAVNDYSANPAYLTYERWERIKSSFWKAVQEEDKTALVIADEICDVTWQLSDYAAFTFREATQKLQQQGLSETEAEKAAGKLPNVQEAVLESMRAKSLFQLEVQRWYEARLTGQPAPLPALPRTPSLPDIFSISTGPASQSFRRGVAGGETFWEESHGIAALRTKAIQGQKEEMYAICRPKADPPLINYFDPEGEAAVSEYLKPAWETVKQMGPDEADWFDLILARFLDGWQQRDRDKPGTWAVIRVEDLNRARARDKGKGFRNEKEREQHHAALRRLFSMKLVWEAASAQQEKPRAEIFDYFQVVEVGQPTLDGRYEVSAFRVCPTWWFDAEMLSDEGHTAMYFEAGLRMVLQIPKNKLIAKAVARYLVGGFWRQRACDPRRSDEGRYKISLAQLFDRAGVAVPEWAANAPAKFAEDVLNQIKQISDSNGEAALVSMPTLTVPSGKGERLMRYLNQEVELKPHPKAPKPLLETIRLLETQGKTQAERKKKIQMQVNIRSAIEKKRTK